MTVPPTRRRLAALALLCAVALMPQTPVTAAPSGGALPPPLTLMLQIAGESGVPADAVGVALNVTVTNPMAAGFLTVYPCGDRPLASNLNYVADQTVPNFVIAALDPDGAVCIDTMTTTDVVVDLAGYIPAGSDVTPLPAPTRFLDTRIGLGVPSRVGGLTVTEVPLAGAFGVPADAQSVVINATVVDPEAAGFISVFPCDGGGLINGGTSTLNFAAGQIVPNLVTTTVGEAGKVCVYSTVGADLVADVAAYVPAGGTGLTTMPFPRRFVDTRFGVGGPVARLGSDVRTVAIGGVNDVPADAGAVIANITATNGSAAGYIAAFPCGQPVPLVSNVNFLPGQSIANMAVVALGPGGQLCMRSMVPVDVVVDVTGYVTDTSAFVPLPPSRVYDSREGVDPPCGGMAVAHSTTVGQPKNFVLLRPGNALPQALMGQPTWEPPISAFIDPTCRISLTGFDQAGAVIYEYTRDGVPLRHYRPVLPFSLRELTATAFGLVGLVEADAGGGRIVHIESGATLAVLPTTHRADGAVTPWGWLGATDDGSLLAVQRYLGDLRWEVAYWDDSGQSLGAVTLPQGYLPTELSPAGSYLTVSTETGLTGRDLAVTTLDGTLVANLARGRASWFMNDGSLATCIETPTSQLLPMVRWDLFGAPTPLAGSQWGVPCNVEDVR
jgi:hypothetical protein